MMPARFGDSASDTIVGQAEVPSLRAMVMSLFLTPIVTIWLRSAAWVRWALIGTNDRPRSVDLKTRLAATKSVFASCGEKTIGVSQFQRYDSLSASGCGRIEIVSPVIRSTRTMLPFCDSL